MARDTINLRTACHLDLNEVTGGKIVEMAEDVALDVIVAVKDRIATAQRRR